MTSQNSLKDDVHNKCIACCESIKAGARICPHCRSPQLPQRLRYLTTSLKFIGAIVTIVSLVLGMASLNGLYRNWKETRQAVAEMVSAAQEMEKIGEYQATWDIYQKALEIDPGYAAIRSGQVRLAMNWLINIRIVNNETFTEIVDKLIPVLYKGISSAQDDQASTILSHIGWAYFLKGREIPLVVDVEAIYNRAIKLDPDNIHANAMLGHWFLAQKGDFENSRSHFRIALDNSRDRVWIREMELGALFWRTWNKGAFNKDKAALRIANEMRKNNEALPSDYCRRLIMRSYGSGYIGENVEMLLEVLPKDEQLATLQWLTNGLERNRSSKSQEKYVIARLTEAIGDTSHAIALYREMAKEDFHENLNVRIDEAIKRLTGEITHRMKERMSRKYFDDSMKTGDNPWQFHVETLLNFNPGFLSKNMRDALNFFDEQVIEGPIKSRAKEALGIFHKSREHIRLWIEEKESERKRFGYCATYSVSSAMNARFNYYNIWDMLGQIALRSGLVDQAVAELENLLSRLNEDKKVLKDYGDFKPRVAFNLACAYSQRAMKHREKERNSLRDKDIQQALKYLEISVNEKNRIGEKVDWQLIKTSACLTPLRSHEIYKKLIRGR